MATTGRLSTAARLHYRERRQTGSARKHDLHIFIFDFAALPFTAFVQGKELCAANMVFIWLSLILLPCLLLLF